MTFARDTTVPNFNTVGNIVPKAVQTVSGNSAWFNAGDFRELIAQLDCDAGTGTTPTLDVKIRTSYDGTDATAIDIPGGSFAQATTLAAAEIKSMTIAHKWIKVVWTIAGTTPSYNFGVNITARR